MKGFINVFRIANRKIIEPEIAEITPFEDKYFKVASSHF